MMRSATSSGLPSRPGIRRTVFVSSTALGMAVQHLRADVPRTDGVHRHALARDLQRLRLGKTMHAHSCRGVIWSGPNAPFEPFTELKWMVGPLAPALAPARGWDTHPPWSPFLGGVPTDWERDLYPPGN
jgi:hypothetical protein